MAAKTGSANRSAWIDYLLGRNALIGVASMMLLAISGYATWSGMSDFIIGLQANDAATSGREIPGGLTVSNEMLVIAIVVALTFLMWLALRETFRSRSRFSDRMITLPLYLFLALWSIGFGYGFWWSLIAGQEATQTSLAGLQEDARDAGAKVAARLDAVQLQLDSVVSWSDSQMAREESAGGSCGRPSGAGRGPLYAARENVRNSVATLRDGISTSWLGPIKADLEALRAAASGLGGGTVADRQKQFEQVARDIRGRARAIAARSNALGQSTAAEMKSLAAVVAIPPGKAGFSCHDPTLAQRLQQAAVQAGEPVSLDLRVAEFNEGPAGVANAVKRVWSKIGSVFAGGFNALISLATGKPAEPTDTGSTFTGRDLIALLASIGVDLGLFVLTVLNPPVMSSVRLSSRLNRRIKDAVLTAIESAPGDEHDLSWVRRHFIEHSAREGWFSDSATSASYFVMPNLYDGRASAEGNQVDMDKLKRALAMNQLAGVLTDLGLIRALTGRELETFRLDEERASLTDLTEIRKAWAKRVGDDAYLKEQETQMPLRNHGLFSKAETALRVAEWDSQDVRDIEIFRLVDTEGLTPLLMVLNQPETELAKDVAD